MGNIFSGMGTRELSFGAWFGLMMALVLPHPAAAGEGIASTKERQGAIAVFGGLMTDNDWQDTFQPWTLNFLDSAFAGLAASYVFYRFDHRFGFEIEGQVIRHFGDQDNWEFNLPIIGRWEAFPWDDVVDTSLALGIGPSYASEIPKLEAANTGGGDRLLVYWMVEIEAGPPDKSWSAMIRLHHRSGAFGLASPEGKSNAVVIGLRQRF